MLCKSYVAAIGCQCFFFNDTATTEIYSLSLHDALPISAAPARHRVAAQQLGVRPEQLAAVDRESTRLNSSHRTQSRMPSSARKKKSHAGSNASASPLGTGGRRLLGRGRI